MYFPKINFTVKYIVNRHHSNFIFIRELGLLFHFKPYMNYVNSKVAFIPPKHYTMTHRGSGGIAPCHLDLGTRWM
jgi:hypothetical protein